MSSICLYHLDYDGGGDKDGVGSEGYSSAGGVGDDNDYDDDDVIDDDYAYDDNNDIWATTTIISDLSPFHLKQLLHQWRKTSRLL